jgi:hypothetical protein
VSQVLYRQWGAFVVVIWRWRVFDLAPIKCYERETLASLNRRMLIGKIETHSQGFLANTSNVRSPNCSWVLVSASLENSSDMQLSLLSAMTFVVVSHVVFQIPLIDPSSCQTGVQCHELEMLLVRGREKVDERTDRLLRGGEVPSTN